MSKYQEAEPRSQTVLTRCTKCPEAEFHKPKCQVLDPTLSQQWLQQMVGEMWLSSSILEKEAEGFQRLGNLVNQQRWSTGQKNQFEPGWHEKISIVPGGSSSEPPSGLLSDMSADLSTVLPVYQVLDPQLSRRTLSPYTVFYLLDAM